MDVEELVNAPGFPKAIRLAGAEGRVGRPRWIRADISKYIAFRQGPEAGGRTKRGGRPRNPIEF